MTRVKRGIIKNKRRKNILSQTKGFRFGRSTKIAQAKDALSTQELILLHIAKIKRLTQEVFGQHVSMPQSDHLE